MDLNILNKIDEKMNDTPKLFDSDRLYVKTPESLDPLSDVKKASVGTLNAIEKMYDLMISQHDKQNIENKKMFRLQIFVAVTTVLSVVATVVCSLLLK